MPYPVPTIPETPSSSINEVLRNHFSEPPDNVLKAVISHFVCAQFSSILMAYKALRRGSTQESLQLWAAACALVSLTLALASFLLYKIPDSRIEREKTLLLNSSITKSQLIMMSTMVLYATIRYGLGGLALIGLLMGVAGVVFFDHKHEDRPLETSGTAAAAANAAEQKLGYSLYKPAAVTKTFQETDIDKTD